MFQRPTLPLAVLVELGTFLQRQHFSKFVVLFFVFLKKVATFILLSYASESNCFLFLLKIHRKTSQSKQTRIRSRVLNIIALGFVLIFSPLSCVSPGLPFQSINKTFGDAFCSVSSLSLTPVLQLPLLLCGKTTGICFLV